MQDIRNKEDKKIVSEFHSIRRKLLGMELTRGEGNCRVEGNCFSNLNYRSSEDCTFTLDGIAGWLLFSQFDVYEDGSGSCGYDDYLEIDGVKYCNNLNPPPSTLTVSDGDTITFHSDCVV